MAVEELAATYSTCLSLHHWLLVSYLISFRAELAASHSSMAACLVMHAMAVLHSRRWRGMQVHTDACLRLHLCLPSSHAINGCAGLVALHSSALAAKSSLGHGYDSSLHGL